MSSLTHLCISTAIHPPFVADAVRVCAFWATVVHKNLIREASNLVSLSIAGHFHSPNDALRHLPSMPQLKYLVLNTPSSAPRLSPEAGDMFVGRHPTLECIEMGRGARKLRWTREIPPGWQDT
ncbi:hypothetical protein FA95DRAFT_1611577 [Auriscalpium vulgare]|uniref:Uncharacterized protein n=1 Tax=Auriscalpium vulgare TaxID=40419 RepID=A0ACB8R9B2_9AGAM|nr:hypothetical protein FA95DRAFT_1611577 [Auriscalpium vulgare]